MIPSSAQRFCLFLMLLGCASGCTSDAASTPSLSPEAAVSVTPSPVASPAATSSSDPASNRILEDARDVAAGAITISQSARSADDWKLVASQWQRAVDKLLVLPESHPEKAQANELIAVYRRNLLEAEAQTGKLPAAAPATPAAAPSPAAAPATTPVAAPPAPVPAEPAAPPVDAKLALAQHLQKTARLYSTYWCSTCKYQKNLFGPEAQALIPEVECDPRGENPQTELCRQQGVRAYPTWEINGQVLQPGALSLSELAQHSGYSGPANF